TGFCDKPCPSSVGVGAVFSTTPAAGTGEAAGGADSTGFAKERNMLASKARTKISDSNRSFVPSRLFATSLVGQGIQQIANLILALSCSGPAIRKSPAQADPHPDYGSHAVNE